MYEYKSFADHPQRAKEAIACMAQMSGGGNSDGDAVSMAYDRLKQRPESRKILLVLSDGKPCSSGIGGLQRTFLRDTVDRVERAAGS